MKKRILHALILLSGLAGAVNFAYAQADSPPSPPPPTPTPDSLPLPSFIDDLIKVINLFKVASERSPWLGVFVGIVLLLWGGKLVLDWGIDIYEFAAKFGRIRDRFPFLHSPMISDPGCRMHLSLERQRVKVSVGRGSEKPIPWAFNFSTLKNTIQKWMEEVNQAGTLSDLRGAGGQMYQEYVQPLASPNELTQALANNPHLLVYADPQIPLAPFECFYDQDFWGLRLPLARLNDRQPESEPAAIIRQMLINYRISRHSRWLIVLNPTGDLKLAEQKVNQWERSRLRDLEVNVLRGAEATAQAVKGELAKGVYDIAYFVCHYGRPEQDQEKGLLLSNNEVLTAENLASQIQSLPLMFICGCQAAESTSREVGGLAPMLTGFASECVGTDFTNPGPVLWLIAPFHRAHEIAAVEFAHGFFDRLLDQCALLRALPEARAGLADNLDALRFTAFANSNPVDLLFCHSVELFNHQDWEDAGHYLEALQKLIRHLPKEQRKAAYLAVGPLLRAASYLQWTRALYTSAKESLAEIRLAANSSSWKRIKSTLKIWSTFPIYWKFSQSKILLERAGKASAAASKAAKTERNKPVLVLPPAYQDLQSEARYARGMFYRGFFAWLIAILFMLGVAWGVAWLRRGALPGFFSQQPAPTGPPEMPYAIQVVRPGSIQEYSCGSEAVFPPGDSVTVKISPVPPGELAWWSITGGQGSVLIERGPFGQYRTPSRTDDGGVIYVTQKNVILCVLTIKIEP